MEFKTFCLPLALGVIILMHTADSQDYQQNSPDIAFYEQKKRWAELTKPVQFTRGGVQTFLQEIFNRREYVEEVMPHTLCHLIEFLAYAKATNQDVSFIESAIRLFLNKMKRVRYFSAEAACNVTERLPELLRDCFVMEQETMLDTAKREIKKVLYNMFLSHFAFFKAEPDKFFDQVCDEVAIALQEKNMHSPVSKEQCRQLTIRFLELMLSKVIWNASDQEEIWVSFKTLSNNLARCEDEKLINRDELDDLLCSLLERFIYFLELRGAELSKNVIDAIKADIAAGTLVIANVEEQEDYIEPKIARLEHIMMETEAKILAREKGIVTDLR